MNKYFRHCINSENDRDKIFKSILEKYNQKPINILEIGCARNLDFNAKAGDGWSTLFFAIYINKYGGSLKVVDIDQNSLNNCKIICSDFDFIKYFQDDGKNHINSNYDLIYLDGADDPNQMVEQYKLIDREKTDILCDDWHSKGTKLSELTKDYIIMKANEGHPMAFFHKNLDFIPN